ncbi:MAG TPA: hypothetical protein VF438_04185 [Candidatus Paceibacterota bacterium]
MFRIIVVGRATNEGTLIMLLAVIAVFSYLIASSLIEEARTRQWRAAVMSAFMTIMCLACFAAGTFKIGRQVYFTEKSEAVVRSYVPATPHDLPIGVAVYEQQVDLARAEKFSREYRPNTPGDVPMSVVLKNG